MLCPVCQTPNSDDATRCRACGSPLEAVAAPFASDEVALPSKTPLHGGAFVLEELLGAGGFGLTYRATETALGRAVAVKEFFPFGSTRSKGAVRPPTDVSSDEWRTNLEAFRQEALALARFNHPAIVRAYAVWPQNGTAYFAMEFLQGQSLQKRLEGGRPLPEDEALSIIESIGAALESVHEAGFLHRDIKPDNILLCDGRAVLIDFGTARAFASDKTTPMTQLLTPGYAPLEQYGQRARFGPFTDVYALAATLYHALSGQAPPSATDRATGVELRPLDEQNPRVSPRLARAVEAALEIAVPKRPQTVAAWLQLLRDAQKPVPPPAPPRTVDPRTIAPRTVAPPVPRPALPSAPLPSSSAPRTMAPPAPVEVRPAPPRVERSAPDVPFAPDIPPEARTPRWVLPLLIVVPLVALGVWWNYDPSRADLTQFDARVRPILTLQQQEQSAFTSLNRSTPEAFVADLQTRALPLQQQVVDKTQSLSPQSDEALFSRDQLLDAGRDRLTALQALAEARDEGAQSAALDELSRADEELAIWRDDFAFLKRQHRVAESKGAAS